MQRERLKIEKHFPLGNKQTGNGIIEESERVNEIKRNKV